MFWSVTSVTALLSVPVSWAVLVTVVASVLLPLGCSFILFLPRSLAPDGSSARLYTLAGCHSWICETSAKACSGESKPGSLLSETLTPGFALGPVNTLLLDPSFGGFSLSLFRGQCSWALGLSRILKITISPFTADCTLIPAFLDQFWTLLYVGEWRVGGMGSSYFI